ncbi:hypothetical protein OV079_20610 [Nannocystis pusilla]|uniref:PEGA domain-containing protein n=1 Tax=Nannocystis pusilla TaxID=889268 RepID=A0A9X3EPN4_9BACT|nr:hypothetical protein [Nannocystis pusilla]MCY1007913.1 hypothetical protein [Nannocystis pusilla]
MSGIGLALWMVLVPAPDCVRAAGEALAHGQVEGAARRGEACFRAGGHPQGLLLASQAWLQAGRMAHARLAAQRYLALRTAQDKTARNVAELVSASAVRESGTVHLAVDPTVAPDEPLTVTATREGEGEALTLRARWDELREGGAATLVLDPGRWVVTIARPGFVDARLEVTSAKGQVTTLAADMTRTPRTAGVTLDERRRRRSWAIAAPLIGGAGIVSGAAVTAVSLRGCGSVLKDMSCGSDASVAGCRRPMAIWTERGGGGAAALGLGAGVLVAGLTGLARDEGVRRRLWTAEAIAGGAVAGAGVATLAYGTTYFVTVNAAEAWVGEAVERGEVLYMTGFGLVGAGLGLAATAAGGLVADALQHRRGRRAAAWQFVGGALRF